MKKIITLFIAVMLTTLGFAQMAPIDFEAGGNGADWTWNVFENDDDPDLEIVANPDPSGINTSATVAQFTARGAGQPFAGVESMHGSDIGTFDLTAANATLNIMVYKTKISDIGLKFATPSGGAQPEIRVTNTLINQWEMITIDFSSQIGLGETTGLDQIIIFPDFIDRPADDIIFFDNITFGAQVIGSVGLPVDFELDAGDYTFVGFEGADSLIEANPDMSGENTSATVMRTTKMVGSQFFAGTFVDIDVPIDFSASQSIAVNTWSPKANIPVRLAIENQATGNQIFVDVNTTVTDTWETLVFDFTGLVDAAVDYNRFVIFFEFIVDLPGDGSTYFFDDVAIFQAATPTIALPVDFELNAGDYTFVGFEGADSLIEANPDMSGENTSATVMRTTKMVGSQFFAGTFVDIDVPIDFSASQSIAVNTWSPKANIPVRLAIENQATGNQIFVDVNTTVTDTWETLVFDFTGLVDAAVDYNRFVIFFEFIVDLPGDGSTYFFDDVEVAGAPMGAPVVLPITFEDANVDYNPIGFEGADSAVEANAVSGGINTSATVLRSTKTEGAQFFAGTAINLGTPIDFNEFEGISLNTYSPKAGIPVKLRLENADNSVGVEVDVNTTVADEWETLTYDFTGLTAGTDFVRIVVFFEFIVDLPGDGSTYYFDDVMVAEPLSVNGFEISTINTFPNPVVDQLNIDAEVAIATISIVNMLGQEVFQSQPEVTNTQLQLAQLKSGMYLVNISDDFGNMKTIKIIKK